MRHLFAAHECTSVQKRGWKGIKNGALMQLAAGEFDYVRSEHSASAESSQFDDCVLELSRRTIFVASAQQQL
jgi:hypothetical protein